MIRAVVELLIALARLALDIAARLDRRAMEREREAARAEHEKIDEDPVDWFIDHFGGVRGADEAPGDSTTTQADVDDD